MWRWTAPHPAWRAGYGWDRGVSCHYIEAADATILVDPLVPAGEEERFFAALDRDVARRLLPVAILLTADQHRRSADELARRYDAAIWEGDGPLPSRVQTFTVEHPRPVERPLWFPSHRALAFGDALHTLTGELRVWWDARRPEGRAWYEERLLPSLRRLLELPVEHVLVGHGTPAPGEELARALERPPVD